ncbi:polysaccharide biosynthesis tyrosine autokinase [Marisediminicola senii]|uniref:polysaccharide biosynthesis tyrosine autokinase n=1 Tax=Marisediminicola senii TaxID=2711233 RepID=UPI0013EA7A94|nr:polysaccharide biosynthesis tyrosine autokinase [Marisediminicola senii]
MEANEYVEALRKRWLLIVAIGLLAAGLAFAVASSLPTIYRATSSVFVATQRGETTSELVQGSTFTQAQVESYAQLADLPIVLEPVIAELQLPVTADALAEQVTADIRLNTVIIDITVSDPSPEAAASIANAVTASLKTTTEQRLSPQGAGEAPVISMETVSAAKVPTGASSPNTRLIVLTGLVGGLALAIGGILARQFLDTRVRSERDLERSSESPVLGVIGRQDAKHTATIVMRTDPHSPQAEDYRRVATNLEFANVDDPVRSVVVTSAYPGEGKTTTAVNLALAMADRLGRVLLIDADLRKPSVADYCQIDGSIGLTSLLVGNATLDDAIRPWGGGLIDVLPSGLVPANPSQMLGSVAMADLFAHLATRYDFIVVDSAPLLPVTDTLSLAKIADGTVLVARFKKSRRQELQMAVRSLEQVTAPVLGLVLNGMVSRRAVSYYGYTDPAGAGAAGAAVTAVVDAGGSTGAGATTGWVPAPAVMPPSADQAGPADPARPRRA